MASVWTATALAQVARPVAGQQQALELGLEGLREHGRAGVGGDLLGGGVGHLAGQAALLDLVVRDIAGSEDARSDAAVRVGDQEAALVGRQAFDRRPFEQRQRDDALDVEHARLPRRLHMQPDPGEVEQVAHTGVEQLQRLGLGRDEVQLRAHAHLVRAGREHQRELVERQRPVRAGRDDERERAQVALLDVLHDPMEPLLVRERAGEGDGAGERHHGPRTGRDQQRVVRQPLTRHGVDLARVGVDRCEPVAHVGEPGVGGEARERVGQSAALGERRQHAQRAVGELGLGGEDGGRDPIAGEAMQGERGFKAGGAAAGDQDGEGHTSKLGPARPRDVREDCVERVRETRRSHARLSR